MSVWKFRLHELAEDERLPFIRSFVERFAESLRRLFPPSSGYEHSEGLVSTKPTELISWNVSRGRLWGLHFSVSARGRAFRIVKISITGQFPIFHRIAEKTWGWNNRIEQLPARIIWTHLLIGPGVLICITLLPLIIAYRVATLFLYSSVSNAGRDLEAIWPGVQTRCPVLVPLSRALPLPVAYTLASALGIAATVGCFWLANTKPPESGLHLALYIVGGILALFSFGVVIALIMSLLGFDVEL